MLVALIVAAADLFSAIKAQDLPAVRMLLRNDPSLAGARSPDGRSAVSAAIAVQVGEGFLPRSKNAVLDAILAAKPQLSPMEVCEVGTADAAKALFVAHEKFVETVFQNGWTPLHADRPPSMSLSWFSRARRSARRIARSWRSMPLPWVVSRASSRSPG